MRILRVAQKVYPEAKGGGAYHVHAMSRDQAAMGHDVIVLTLKTDRAQSHLEERDGYTVLRYPVSASVFGNDISVGVASYLKGACDFDVIHAHSHLYFSTNLAALKRTLGGPPLAITNHGLYSQNAPEWFFDLYLRSIGRWTFNQADVVFCYTDTDRERVQELGVSSRIQIVSNGIDRERFSPDGPESELVDSDGPVVLCVGRLVEGKRPGLALEAFAEVLAEHPDAELYICGEGPLRKELETRIEVLGISNSVTFLGQVPYDEMPAIYRSADVLILPSRAEGVPRTVMEALSADVPAVCSDLPHVRSAFGDSVAYVREEDEFGNQLISVLEHEGDSPGLNERFSWERTVTETTAAVERVVGSIHSESTTR